MLDQAKLNRLRIQQTKLQRLAEQSDLIQVAPLEVVEGWPAEKYLVTYLCRSIVGIEANQQPIFGERHELELYLTNDYPNAEPHLKFRTPIWHPNISSQEPRKVCTNQVESWWVGKDLDELVLVIGELLQYKSYHAKWEPPFPQDRDVAEWVLKYAEPNHIVGKEIPVDVRELLKGWRIIQRTTYVPPPALQHHVQVLETRKILLGIQAALHSEPAMGGNTKRITLGNQRA